MIIIDLLKSLAFICVGGVLPAVMLIGESDPPNLFWNIVAYSFFTLLFICISILWYQSYSPLGFFGKLFSPSRRDLTRFFLIEFSKTVLVLLAQFIGWLSIYIMYDKKERYWKILNAGYGMIVMMSLLIFFIIIFIPLHKYLFGKWLPEYITNDYNTDINEFI